MLDPRETLAALRAAFDLPLLQAAGVIDRLPDGEVRLHPTLCDPVGALIALRTNPAEAPFEVLTAAGCVSRRTLPLLATRDDARTAAQAQQTGHLFASRIQDVALCRRWWPLNCKTLGRLTATGSRSCLHITCN